jgi:thiamine pyridinylase
MKNIRLIFLVILTLGFWGCSKDVVPRRELKVSLYPYLPDMGSLYWEVESQFEAKYPEINLIIELNSDYYYAQDSTNRHGINFDEADVYELDCVFLKDFIASGKIQKLPSSFGLQETDFLPMASISKQDGSWYGAPHWVCGNFLFYRQEDEDLKNVQNLAELEEVMFARPEGSRLLLNFKGSSTLGEFYMTGLFDEYQDYSVAEPFLNPDNISSIILDNMNRVVAMTDGNLGRIDDYSDRLGYYARMFARKKGSAYVGYSESIYYMLTETMQSCALEDSCLNDLQLNVGLFPLSDRGKTPVGWVDMFVIDSAVKSEKLADAADFIRFMLDKETYKAILIPAWGEAPRYILPARTELYTDQELLAAAPLYSKILPVISGTVAITANGLNAKLRQIGKNIDKRIMGK